MEIFSVQSTPPSFLPVSDIQPNPTTNKSARLINIFRFLLILSLIGWGFFVFENIFGLAILTTQGTTGLVYWAATWNPYLTKLVISFSVLTLVILLMNLVFWKKIVAPKLSLLVWLNPLLIVIGAYIIGTQYPSLATNPSTYLVFDIFQACVAVVSILFQSFIYYRFERARAGIFGGSTTFSKVFISTLLILTACVSAWSYIYAQSLKSTSSSGLTGISTALIDISTWQSYSNTELGYSIKYPPLNDSYTQNQPTEVLIYGDPQEVGFPYTLPNASGDIALDKYNPSDCKQIYSKVNPSMKTISIGPTSYYYSDTGPEGAITVGGFLFEAGYLTAQNSFSDGSCLLLKLTAGTQASSSTLGVMTKQQMQSQIDIAYAMLSSLSLSPTTTTAIIKPLGDYATSANIVPIGANRIYRDTHSYVGVCANSAGLFKTVTDQTPVCRDSTNAYIDYVFISNSYGYICVDTSGTSVLIKQAPTGFSCNLVKTAVPEAANSSVSVPSNSPALSVDQISAWQGQLDCGSQTYPDSQTASNALANSVCFDTRFKMCKPATITGIVGDKISTNAVIGPQGNQCEVTLDFSGPSGSAGWTCLFDPTQPFSTSNDSVGKYCKPSN
ncbi:MAG: hypothetical protein KGI69_00885 [Patescibacteria group bacterium]|nr:hypothetical protein [Patescibacteria group bacterium]